LYTEILFLGGSMSWIGYQRAVLTIISFIALAFGFLFLFIGNDKIGCNYATEFCFVIAFTAFTITIFIKKEKIEKEFKN